MPSSDGAGRKQILFLTPQLPYPPEQGAALRNYNLIAQMARHHDLDLLSFTSPGATDLGHMQTLCRSVRAVPAPHWRQATRLRRLLTSLRPDMAWRLHAPEYLALLRQAVTACAYDVIQVEGIEMAPYGLLAQRWAQGHPKLVYDAHNAEYLLQRRACQADLRIPRRWPAAAYSAIQTGRLARFERAICRAADAVVAVSDADAAALRTLGGALRPVVIPNGVDCARYHAHLGDALPLRHPALVFTGKMDFRPNTDAVLWFYRHVWPLVTRDLPGAVLYIVGRAPGRALLELAEDAQVELTGYVHDILPYFGGADVYLVPLRIGGGTRLKVLEAMAAGLPIVSTRLGAEGIPVVHGEHALLADTPEAFAAGILTLWRDRRLAAELGRQARAFACAHYDWGILAPRLGALYERLLGI